MDKISTLNKLAEFAQVEQELFDDLNKACKDMSEKEDHYEPRTDVVKSILDYSKALSVRPSKHIKQISILLN